MKKKTYRKPTTQVVLLQHECHLLAGSERSTDSNALSQDDYESVDWSRENDLFIDDND